jgi:LEA14-like dessication related protein
MTRRGWLWLALAAALLTGCAGMYKSLEPPRVTLVDMQPLEMKLFEQRYALQLRIQNPNPYDLPITGMDFRMRINDADFASGVSRTGVTVPAYGERVIDVEVSSSLVSLLRQLQDVGKGDRQTFSYGLSGHIRIAGRLATVPFAYRGEIGLGP